MSVISEKRVPALRFMDEQGRDYPDWEHKRLGELYDITSSKRVFQSEWKDSGVPFYRAREIIELSNDGFVDNDLFISPEMYKRYSEKYGAPKQNDLLITGVGTIGKLYIVPKNSNFYIKDGNIIWLKDKKLVSGVFVKYLFLTRYIEKQLFDNASITTVATYTIEAAKKTKVLLPVVAEQHKIAAFLSTVDTKIEQLNRKKSLLEQYKKGMMQKLFSQEIRFKDENGRDYPDWLEKRLVEIAKLHRGSGLSKSATHLSGKIPCILYGELFTKYRETISYVHSFTDDRTPVIGKYGDILMPASDVTPDGLATASALLVEGVQLGGDINIIRLDKGAHPVFISYMINSRKKKVMRLVTGTTVKHIYPKDIQGVRISIPASLEEQQKIANFLSAIDNKIELVADQIGQAQVFKKGLLQQMFI